MISVSNTSKIINSGDKKSMSEPYIKFSDKKGNAISFCFKKVEDLNEALRKAHIPLDEFSNASAPPEKIKMKSITFEFGEGYATTRFPISFATWEEANDFLWQKSFQEGYYLKHDFVVEYEDGKKYYFHVEDIAEFLSFCSEEIQQKVKRQLLTLDSQNGSIYQFLESIAKGIANISQQKNLTKKI